MERRKFIGAFSLAGIIGAMSPKNILAATDKSKTSIGYAINDREYWWKLLNKIASPVVSNLANGTLIKNMPVEKSPTFDSRSLSVTYLEAVGRTYAGIAPWLALPDDESAEGIARKKLRADAVNGLNKCFAPGSPDALNFAKDYQPIVDAAYLAQSFLRAPKALWEPLEAETKQRIISAFKSLRNRKPFKSNWLLFGSITEAFLLSVGEDYDAERLNEGPKKLNEWYKGDGWYGDGPNLAFDYYNSFVIHPMMVDTLAVMADKKLVEQKVYDLALKRMQRYAVGQERMISPEGTYPAIGRSITYRTGAFQALSQVALMEKLPESIKPAQVRCALTKVKQNMYGTPGTFDKNDWLQLGFCGHQSEIADYYTSTGSLYMATLSFLPLGLPASHDFWTAKPVAWTSKRAWAGEAFAKDYHVDY
ncbi:DUF2264 domain-containing protein [Pedobacter hiemivivus]|uniref:DUF2264 domain-containing protein n=1 Tax=Pedobacter hiemivivus TaxID=2530454 RepID=A0A4U1FWE0_9SPHI|nr:DUF2264 domain-containing protein [Pedobacter hiemivivus]TCC84504.1 DUF2264 domain-containing protein [Pedobacter hiemivivus]TKC55191.1 DUF2264 domain-containing protein [Pedobacter hiemivivus]